MKQYPTIPKVIRNVPAYAFDKLDGSNIRAEWHPKKGFWKFGSRDRLLGTDQPTINTADALIKQKYEDDLSKIFRQERYQEVVAFFEFYGSNSFAGYHVEEPHEVTLFDINVYKKGLMPPNSFMKLFGQFRYCQIIILRKYNKTLYSIYQK